VPCPLVLRNGQNIYHLTESHFQYTGNDIAFQGAKAIKNN